MQTIRPANKYLFCKPEEATATTKSGIILAEAAVEKPKTAVVINVGAEVKGYSAKDKIVYKPYATTEFKLDGDEYFLIADEDVLGTVVKT